MKNLLSTAFAVGLLWLGAFSGTAHARSRLYDRIVDHALTQPQAFKARQTLRNFDLRDTDDNGLLSPRELGGRLIGI